MFWAPQFAIGTPYNPPGYTATFRRRPITNRPQIDNLPHVEGARVTLGSHSARGGPFWAEHQPKKARARTCLDRVRG